MKVVCHPSSTRSYRRLSLIILPWILAVVLMSAAGNSYALDGSVSQYTLRLWQMDDGLPANAVQSIVQTRDGYLWLGTRDGLARFDGARFVVYGPKTVPELKHHIIQALCEARDGSLWIGTDGGGVTVLRDGRFTHYGQTNGLAGDQVRALAATRDGAVWIGTTAGLTRFQDGRFMTFGAPQGLCSAVVRGIHEDSDGGLWIASSVCLARYRDGKFSNFGLASGLLDLTIRSVFRDRKGAVWIGSNNGLARFADGEISTYTKDSGLSGGFIISLFEDQTGVLWVGGYAGLDQIIDGKVVSKITDEGSFNALIYTLCQDREGNIWAGTKEGLARFTPKRCRSYTRQDGLVHNTTVSVCADREGALWVGTWGGGLCRLKDGVFSPVTITNAGYNNLILAIHQTRDGSIWFGTDYSGGAFRLKNNRVQRFGESQGLCGSEVSVLYEDSKTNLWIGTRTALNLYRHGQFTNFTTQEGLPGNAVRVVYEDRQQQLWIGTDGGLSQWHDGVFKNFTTRDGLSHNSVVSLYEDEEGALWIGTRGGGLNRLQGDKFTSWTAAQGVPPDYVYEILPGDGDWLWMSSSKGVFVVDRKELDAVASGKMKSVNCVYYGKSDGMVNAECKGVAKPAACRTADGRFWFPTSKGIVAIDPTIKVREIPPVLIEDVTVNGQRIDPEKPARIVAGNQQFLFRYTALSVVAPEKVKFKHRLEGIDEDWIDAGNRREASYTHMPPGNYQFRVIAANGDGVWNETGAVFSFEVVPPFWKTAWFMALLGLSGVGLVAGSVHFVSVKNIQRKLKQLEQQHAIEKERMRIARDMHDDLGGSLTQIAILSDMARRDLNKPGEAEVHVRKIAESARKTTHALEEIVWAVHPENDTLDHLANYLCQFAEEFFRNTPVRCRVDIPEVVPPQPVSAEMRHNLFLIVKESLNNALKYSEASVIWLRLSVSNSYFTIAVEDNGRGFDLEKQAASGNGMRNLQKRAEDVGARLAIVTAPGKGTRITVTVDLDLKM